MSVYTEEAVVYQGVEATRVRFAVPGDWGKPVETVALYANDCGYCMSERDKEETFFPSHWPSSYCESGKRPHCTCDRCF